MEINNIIAPYLSQSTISYPISVKGRGLHTGEICQVNIFPEKENIGIYFVRKDINNCAILAHTKLVVDTQLSTTIGLSFKHSIRTIEHLMASILILGISNLKIEVYGPEIPIMDGSAINWQKLLKNSKLKRQSALSQIYTLIKPIYVHMNESFILAFPSTKFSITYGISFTNIIPIGNQWSHFSNETTNNSKTSLLRARTFGFLESVKHLKRMGLIQGANLKNALVCDQKYWVNGPLRYKHEPVRHKILDLIGDLGLLGSLPSIRVLAYKSSHTLHIELAKAIKDSNIY